MSGEQANKLVRSAKLIPNLAYLPPYATSAVQSILDEVKDHDKEIINLSANSLSRQASDGTRIKASFSFEDDPAAGIAMAVHHWSLKRNKRCLLAYHRMRTGKLEQMCWKGVDIADATSGSGLQSGPTSSLSASEELYAHRFNDLLAGYKGHWTDIDLTGSLEPPKDIFIDVRVLKDAGEIQTEYGSINLTKNSQFYVRQSDVERLIQQGYLQRLS
jgi:GINS complex subunit 1